MNEYIHIDWVRESILWRNKARFHTQELEVQSKVLRTSTWRSWANWIMVF